MHFLEIGPLFLLSTVAYFDRLVATAAGNRKSFTAKDLFITLIQIE